MGRRVGVLVSGEGSNLQALLDAGVDVAAVASNNPDAGASAAPSGAGVPDRVVPARRATADRDAPRHGDGRLARGARSRARRLRGLHAPAAPVLPRSLPGRGRQRPPGASARLPRRACGRGRPRGRCRRDRRHRAPRRRRASTPGTVLRQERVPVFVGRHAREPARADPRGRAPAPARGREGAGSRHERPARAAVDVRQDRAGRVRRRAAAARRRAARERGHGAFLADAGLEADAARGADRLRGDARAPGRDAASGRARRDPRAARHAGGSGRPRAARARADRSRLRQPLPVRADDRGLWTSRGRRRSRRSTSAARRCCAPRRRITRTSSRSAGPEDYEPVLARAPRVRATVSPATRRALAARAFATTAAYDGAIAGWLGRDERSRSCLTPVFDRDRELAYGENPHQRAAYYAERGRTHAPPRARRAAARQGALLQQPERPLGGAAAGPRARPSAGLRDRQACEPVRRRGGGDDRGGLREGARGRPGLGLRRRRRAHARRDGGARARRWRSSSSRCCSRRGTTRRRWRRSCAKPGTRILNDLERRAFVAERAGLQARARRPARPGPRRRARRAEAMERRVRHGRRRAVGRPPVRVDGRQARDVERDRARARRPDARHRRRVR